VGVYRLEERESNCVCRGSRFLQLRRKESYLFCIDSPLLNAMYVVSFLEA